MWIQKDVLDVLVGGGWVPELHLSSKIVFISGSLLFALESPLSCAAFCVPQTSEKQVVGRPQCKLKGRDASLDIWSPRNEDFPVVGGICNTLASRTIWLYLDLPAGWSWSFRLIFLLLVLPSHGEGFCFKMEKYNMSNQSKTFHLLVGILVKAWNWWIQGHPSLGQVTLGWSLRWERGVICTSPFQNCKTLLGEVLKNRNGGDLGSFAWVKRLSTVKMWIFPNKFINLTKISIGCFKKYF